MLTMRGFPPGAVVLRLLVLRQLQLVLAVLDALHGPLTRRVVDLS